jgi:rod shape-determining protein MreD
MVPERPHYILRPVRVAWIVVSLAAALLLNFVPWQPATLAPDFVAVTLAFWCVRQPRLVGLGAAWLLGLLNDVGSGALLGQHALVYSLLAFGAITLSRRILWFSVWGQALHVAVLLVLAQAAGLGVRLAAGADFPGWSLWLAPLFGALLWPVLTLVLLAPQRRPVDVDETRPI